MEAFFFCFRATPQKEEPAGKEEEKGKKIREGIVNNILFETKKNLNCAVSLFYSLRTVFLLNEFLLLLEKVNFHHYRKKEDDVPNERKERKRERNARQMFSLFFPFFP